VEYIHKPCGHKIDPLLRCSECGEEIRAKDMLPTIDLSKIDDQPDEQQQAG
jgi:hypothetical protein